MTGKIVIANRAEGGIPTIASVQVGQKPPTPVTKGEFIVRDLTPGSYDITFRDIEFAETTKRDIKIEAGKTTDLGTPRSSAATCRGATIRALEGSA